LECFSVAKITEGSIVVIAAFDDIPEHRFQVEAVFDDHITGVALSGPLQGCYGEPGIQLVIRVHAPPLGSS
jgi:hypothetical protein